MSNRDDFFFDTADGVKLSGYRWSPSPGADSVPAFGQLLILHGMAEHCARYDEFAGVLADAGWPTQAFDLRGHGRTGLAEGRSGGFAAREGWLTVLADIDGLVDSLRADRPELPLFLFGHSMGSFFARSYAARHGEKLSGLILSGTGSSPRLVTRGGLLLAGLISLVQEMDSPSRLLNMLTLGSYARSYKNRRTDFDWLSRDKAEVDKYIADEFCGKVYSLGFYIDLLSLVLDKDSPRAFRATPADLPVYLFAGTSDPVGDFSRGVLRAFSRYQKAGVKDLRIKLYQDGRHEMLNETNRKEVQRDVIDWLNDHRPDSAQSPSSPA